MKKVDDKANKNASDILSYESRLKQKEGLINELEREASFFRGDYYYNFIYFLSQSLLHLIEDMVKLMIGN